MKDLDSRLQEQLSRRDRLKVDLERKKGRLEEAERRLKELEDKCREKKIDPENLEEVVQKLETRFESSLEELEKGLNDLETKLLGINVD